MKRKYNLTDTFFDKIDTQEKAYILGFICADGYLTKNGFGIDVKFTDIDILQKVAKAMKFEGNIRNATHKMKRVDMTSKSVNIRLKEIGLTNSKSYNLKKLNTEIPAHLRNHFCRGYLDGDGSITYELISKNYSSKRYRVQIRGTKEFLDYYESLTPFKWSKGFNVTTIIYLSKKKTVKEFLDWLYLDSKIYLDRKFKRYLAVPRA